MVELEMLWEDKESGEGQNDKCRRTIVTSKKGGIVQRLLSQLTH
jgi:hypothetical protein